MKPDDLNPETPAQDGPLDQLLGETLDSIDQWVDQVSDDEVDRRLWQVLGIVAGPGEADSTPPSGAAPAAGPDGDDVMVQQVERLLNALDFPKTLGHPPDVPCPEGGPVRAGSTAADAALRAAVAHEELQRANQKAAAAVLREAQAEAEKARQEAEAILFEARQRADHYLDAALEKAAATVATARAEAQTLLDSARAEAAAITARAERQASETAATAPWGWAGHRAAGLAEGGRGPTEVRDNTQPDCASFRFSLTDWAMLVEARRAPVSVYRMAAVPAQESGDDPEVRAEVRALLAAASALAIEASGAAIVFAANGLRTWPAETSEDALALEGLVTRFCVVREGDLRQADDEEGADDEEETGPGLWFRTVQSRTPGVEVVSPHAGRVPHQPHAVCQELEAWRRQVADHGNTRAILEPAQNREQAGDQPGAEDLYRQAAGHGGGMWTVTRAPRD